MKRQDKEKVLMNALVIMKGKIKKSLLNVDRNEREDLEQAIKLKIVEAVLNGKIQMPPTFSEYKKEFDRKKCHLN